jgi:predicted phosphodiesterase
MKLQLISDIHLNLARDGLEIARFIDSLNPNNDDIVLALGGDISEHGMVELILKGICQRYTAVVYVTGNHEYWHSSLERVNAVLTQLDHDIPNLHWLNNRVLEFDEIRILGSTLWFGHSALSPIYNVGWSDFHQIDNIEDDFYRKNNESIWFFEENLKQGDIVLTHHLPSYRSCSKKFLANPLNIFYANHLDALIEDREPAIWMHGHTHDSCDYNIGNTRILCNPHGYPKYGGLNPGFNDNLVLTVGK